ncbi:MAG: saccharopine dehydrogenase NADP-binding domain-containing protein [Bacteroidota bacterium]
MTNGILLYGATGFTGTLIADEAKNRGIDIILSGRDEAKLKTLSDRTGFAYRIIMLDNKESMKKGLDGISAVINIAGPFISELPDFVEMCIQLKVNFIDLAMDPDVLADYDTSARENSVMLLSGAGHAFLPMDCLGGLLYTQMPDAQRLSIFISGMNTMSRGTAKSNIALIKQGIHHKRNGKRYKIRNMKPVQIQFNNDSKLFVPASFGVATLGFSTEIPTIETYFEATPAVKPFIFIIKYLSWLFGFPFMQKFLEKRMNSLPAGPNEEQRNSGHVKYFARIENENTNLFATLTTPEAYKTTYLATLAVIEKLKENSRPGFQTPFRLFGTDMLNEIPGFTLKQN